jgi:hypothetical protein
MRKINFVFLVFLVLAGFTTSELQKVISFIGRGYTVPAGNIKDIEDDIKPFLSGNLMPQGMDVFNEFGYLLRKKYIDSGFIKSDEFDSKAKLYTSDLPSDVHSLIGVVMGLVPRNVPKLYMLDGNGSVIDYLGDFSFDKEQHFLKRKNYEKVNIEVIAAGVNIILNPKTCINFQNTRIEDSRVDIPDAEFVEILSLRAVLPNLFEDFCGDKNCNDDGIFRDKSFLLTLYNFIKFIKDFQIATKQDYENVFKILQDFNTHEIYSSEVNFNKFTHSPFFKYINSILESPNSQCPSPNVNNKSTPSDVLMNKISESKCKNFILMLSPETDILAITKALFDNKDIFKSDEANVDLIKLFSPEPARSFIFELHKNDNKLFLRIFYNLVEINKLEKIRLKLTYLENKGIELEHFIDHFSIFIDDHISYKDSCV